MTTKSTDVLAVILNYKRPANTARIVEALAEQTLRPRIAVWNNGVEGSFGLADHVFSTAENLFCMPRWHVTALLGQQYVVIIDDDLIPARTNVLEQCVEASREHEDRRIIGYNGKQVGRGPEHYQNGRRATATSNLFRRPRDNYADIVKGRFMFLHVRLLERVPLVCPHYFGRGDDIWVSLKTAPGPRHHLIPAFTHDAFEDLDAGAEALCADPTHLERRDEMIRDMIAAGDLDWVPGAKRLARSRVDEEADRG